VPIVNSKGAKVTTSAVYEQQIFSDAWLSHMGSCAVTRRLSMQVDDFNQTLLTEMIQVECRTHLLPSR
jgi:deferrochelatase/peroxidase EfeB